MATISILIDNPKSWFVPYGERLREACAARGHTAHIFSDPAQLAHGDVAFFLSCEQIISKELRDRNVHNLVIHASALPHGKGWSPLTWQILEGKSEIPLTLFEAADNVDAGEIYMTSSIHLEGHELIEEIREREGAAIVDLALAFVDAYPEVSGTPQEGGETFYARRTPKDSELDPHKSLVELFDQLRVADNERYPAFFEHKGHTYILKINKRDA